MSSLIESNKIRTLNKTHKSPRPEGVPRLELATIIGDNPTDQKPDEPIDNEKSVFTPSSKSTVSWGTPVSNPYILNKKDIEFGGTVYRPCSHLKHRPNSRWQQRNPITHKVQAGESELKSEISAFSKTGNTKSNEAYGFVKNKPKVTISEPAKQVMKSPKNKNQESGKPPKKKEDYWYLDDHLKPKPPSPEPEDVGYTVDEMAQMQAEYTEQPYSDLHDARKSAAEGDIAKKQREEIIEQVLVDQLSRHVISDAEQDRDPARQNPANPASPFNTAPLRFKSRRLHDTKVSTAGAATESKLKDRVTFSARLLTRNGRDALRDLFGFFFHTDRTVTVYEYRLFGKNTNKALPVIERGKYSHVTGRRKGKPYNPTDFQIGRNLSFSTKNQPALPDSLRKSPTVVLRIYDSSSTSSVGNWDIPSSDRDDGSDTALERNDRKITQNVQGFVRSKLRDRSVSVLVGMGQMFRSMDVSGDGMLSKSELAEALESFDIKLPEKDFGAVWRVVDENDDGAIDYGEFMRAFIGEMNETRKQLVRKVFKKLDPHKTGYANLLDLQKLYSAKKHPLVLSGNFSQPEMEEHFMASFSDICSGRDGRVSYVEFVDYYEGVSIMMQNDDGFVNMMRNCWGV